MIGFDWGSISEYEVCPEGTYKVALVLDLNPNDMDFHWYRQNKDGAWSHKPADGEVQNWDYYGNPIYNQNIVIEEILILAIIIQLS